ncbi:heterokaryon incompatibility protein-domain-containing protein [Halenospora varia]|nr:heterokaryon incompatibility protein-domain-containing protein [Halenospora varia]
MAPRKLFRHQLLNYEADQIRLLQVRSGSCSLIQCTLQHYDLAACPPYKAISYTWGRLYPTKDILINGARFSVRENLWQFLCTLQPDENDFFWIDQICVDQENIEERNHQVECMGDIYHEAFEVIIWLGAAESGSAHAMDFVLQAQARNLGLGDRSWAVDVGSTSCVGSPSSSCQSFDLSAAPVKALRVLFRKPYWSRVWIVQEIMLARHLLLKYGDRIIKWEDLQDFKVWCKQNGDLQLGTCFESLSGLIPRAVKTIINNKLQWGLGETWKAPNHDLRHVLSTYTECECEDVHDKVYGLQGLVFFGERVLVDYRQGLEGLTNDVLRIVAKESLYDAKRTRALHEFAILFAYNIYSTDLRQFSSLPTSRLYEIRRMLTHIDNYVASQLRLRIRRF